MNCLSHKRSRIISWYIRYKLLIPLQKYFQLRNRVMPRHILPFSPQGCSFSRIIIVNRLSDMRARMCFCQVFVPLSLWKSEAIEGYSLTFSLFCASLIVIQILNSYLLSMINIRIFLWQKFITSLSFSSLAVLVCLRSIWPRFGLAGKPIGVCWLFAGNCRGETVKLGI